jgi:hypothetical protein
MPTKSLFGARAAVVEVNSDISVGGKTPADLIFGTLAAELGKPTGTK